jgi:formimidoylglutamate deiminase
LSIGSGSHVTRDWREELRWLDYGARLQLRARNVAGARADALVVDTSQDQLLGILADRLLDALVFSSPAPCWREVMVAGRWVLREPGQAERIAKRFEQAMAEIWAEPVRRP